MAIQNAHSTLQSHYVWNSLHLSKTITIYYHEELDSNLDKRISTSTDRTPTNYTSKEGNRICEQVLHLQDQDSSELISIRLRNVQTQDCDVKERPTRKNPRAPEEFQDCDWRDRGYVGVKKDKLFTYYIMWRSTPIIWKTNKKELWNNQCTLAVRPEEFTPVFLPINTLSNQKRAMCCAMRKPRDIPFKRDRIHNSMRKNSSVWID